MTKNKFIKWSGLAAAVGGGLWLLLITQAGQYANTLPLSAPIAFRVLYFTTMIMIILSLFGLDGYNVSASFPSTPDSKNNGFGQSGVKLLVGGSIFLLIVMLVVTANTNPEASAVLRLLAPYSLLTIALLGTFVTSIYAIKVENLPRWLALALAASVLLLLGFEPANWRMILAMPFGLLWMIMGWHLWHHIPEAISMADQHAS